MGSLSTPMMKQYYSIKREHPDALLMFRMGDFYETFGEDARTVSRELDIVLTARDRKSKNPVPLAGIPYHALDSYLAKLIRRGYRVAICDQLEDPQAARGLVKRGVVRVVSPGTIVEGLTRSRLQVAGGEGGCGDPQGAVIISANHLVLMRSRTRNEAASSRE